MTRTGLSARQYVRQLEQALAERAEGPRVFTQKDYRLATTWHEAGIPVGLILELLAGRQVPARSLAQIARKVEDAWKTVCAGRIREGEPQAAGDPRCLDPAARLAIALEAAPPSGNLHRFLAGLLEACRAGASPDELEGMVAAGLPLAVSEDRLREAEDQARATLADHGRRMPPEAYRETLRKGVLARLRRQNGIPRFH